MQKLPRGPAVRPVRILDDRRTKRRRQRGQAKRRAIRDSGRQQ
jgi:hypothetical protein